MFEMFNSNVSVMELCLCVSPPHIDCVTIVIYFIQLFLQLTVYCFFFFIKCFIVIVIMMLSI
jgi:hypothetical protein